MIQFFIDAIISAVDATVNNSKDTLEILSKVNEFHDTSWNKLLYLITGGFAVLGVFMPFIIQHFQARLLKASEAEIASKVKKVLEEEFDKKLEDKIAEFKEETKKNHNLFSALFLQFNADNLAEKNDYYKSVIDYTGAIGFYTDCEDLGGIAIVLNNLNNSINNLTEEELEKLKIDKEINLKEVLKEIDNIENSLVLKDKINLITEIIN